MKDDIFWLVLKLNISYNILKDFDFLFSKDFLKIRYIFYRVKYLSFHNSSSFALKNTFFNVNGKATIGTHPLL